MEEYTGAVFFVDILGIGALTQGEIKINQKDFSSHTFNYTEKFSNQIFCAKILFKFRKILAELQRENINVNFAQLSDCAFIWSRDINSVVRVAKDLMWKALSRGILCRGGISYGQIVEPEKTNIKLGKFICGNAATDAVNLEKTCKGARIFVKKDIKQNLKSNSEFTFIQRKNPLDRNKHYEFIWFSTPKIDKISKLISALDKSDKFKWNRSSKQGLAQIYSTIDVLHSEVKKTGNRIRER